MHKKEIHLGDERHIDRPVIENEKKRSPTRQEWIERTEVATRAYIGLARELKDQNLTDYASAARLRYKRLNRRRMFMQRKPGSFIRGIGSGLLDYVSGYGEIPERTFGAYLIVVVFFSAVYWDITHQYGTGTPPLQWYEAIVLSLSSFHGRGFFTNTISLGDPLAVVAAFEAVIGLFIELILIATFSRRFLGD